MRCSRKRRKLRNRERGGSLSRSAPTIIEKINKLFFQPNPRNGTTSGAKPLKIHENAGSRLKKTTISHYNGDSGHCFSDATLERKLSDIKQYLLDHVMKEPGPLGDDCWIWTASLTNGYAQTYWNGVIGRGHRMSYEKFNGPIPPGCQVQHRCDRKNCINPKHLKLGDHSSNKADIFSRGDPDLTDREIETLCLEQASLRRRDEAIIAQLRRAIRDRRQATRDIIKEHRAAMREQRRAAGEELEQQRQERRTQKLARRSPEALARSKASIAELKESTPEELKADRVAEIAERKQQRLRRLGPMNGFGGFE